MFRTNQQALPESLILIRKRASFFYRWAEGTVTAVRLGGNGAGAGRDGGDGGLRELGGRRADHVADRLIVAGAHAHDGCRKWQDCADNRSGSHLLTKFRSTHLFITVF